jgi:hypothetical protein
MAEPKLRRVIANLCTACIAGEGEECHTPGCILWLHRVDLPIHEELLTEAPALLSERDRGALAWAAGMARGMAEVNKAPTNHRALLYNADVLDRLSRSPAPREDDDDGR